MFSQFYYLVLDRRVPVLDSFRQSKELMNGNKLTLFLIWLAMMGIFLVAMIPCGLGILVAGPYFSLMFAVIYLTITGQPTAEQVVDQTDDVIVERHLAALPSARLHHACKPAALRVEASCRAAIVPSVGLLAVA